MDITYKKYQRGKLLVLEVYTDGIFSEAIGNCAIDKFLPVHSKEITNTEFQQFIREMNWGHRLEPFARPQPTSY